MQDHIYVKGARENNLKNVDVTIPRDKLVVLTGLSGSGKSSLAFDTIYAEGQRRYVESLSSYARMFLGQMEKPDVDYIDGLSPAISIDQKRPPARIPGPPWALSPRSMTISACSGPGWAPPTALYAARRSNNRPSTRSSTRCWSCPRHPDPGHGPGDPGQEGRARQGLRGRTPLRLCALPGGRHRL